MSKNKIMLPILAAIVGVAASAFTVQNQNPAQRAQSVKEDSYYWFESPYNGSNYQDLQTRSLQIAATGCDGSQTECQKGFTQGQLINGDPTQGVKPTEKSNPANEIYVHQ